MTSTFVLKSVR